MSFNKEQNSLFPDPERRHFSPGEAPRAARSTLGPGLLPVEQEPDAWGHHLTRTGLAHKGNAALPAPSPASSLPIMMRACTPSKGCSGFNGHPTLKHGFPSVQLSLWQVSTIYRFMSTSSVARSLSSQANSQNAQLRRARPATEALSFQLEDPLPCEGQPRSDCCSSVSPAPHGSVQAPVVPSQGGDARWQSSYQAQTAQNYTDDGAGRPTRRGGKKMLATPGRIPGQPPFSPFTGAGARSSLSRQDESAIHVCCRP